LPSQLFALLLGSLSTAHHFSDGIDRIEQDNPGIALSNPVVSFAAASVQVFLGRCFKKEILHFVRQPPDFVQDDNRFRVLSGGAGPFSVLRVPFSVFRFPAASGSAFLTESANFDAVFH